MIRNYSDEQLREMGIAEHHIYQFHENARHGSPHHFHIIDEIGAIDWAKKEIISLLKEEEKVKIHPTGLRDDKDSSYCIFFEIHPMFKAKFIKNYVPKMAEICKKHGINGYWA